MNTGAKAVIGIGVAAVAAYVIYQFFARGGSIEMPAAPQEIRLTLPQSYAPNTPYDSGLVDSDAGELVADVEAEYNETVIEEIVELPVIVYDPKAPSKL